MYRISLAFTALFFIASMGSGVMAARQGRGLWHRLFWLSMILFLSASSSSLLAVAPPWIAVAPLIPALIIALILVRSRNSASENFPESHRGSDHEN